MTTTLKTHTLKKDLDHSIEFDELFTELTQSF